MGLTHNADRTARSAAAETIADQIALTGFGGAPEAAQAAAPDAVIRFALASLLALSPPLASFSPEVTVSKR